MPASATPETQVYLTRLENDLRRIARGEFGGDTGEDRHRLDSDVLSVRGNGSAGYPGAYEKGKAIRELDEVAKMPNTKVFHAGTARRGQEIVTNGGRVLGVTALGSDLAKAREQAYAAAEKIEFEGAHYRKDIATGENTKHQARSSREAPSLKLQD